MSAWLIIITGIIYLYVALEQWYYHQNIGMLITYLGYSFSNIGLYILASK
jgi:hypothetical protein